MRLSMPSDPPSAAPVIDPDALLWKAAVVAAGGRVTDPRLLLVSTLIGSLKSAGVWTLLDRLWLMAAELDDPAQPALGSKASLIDLVARVSATAVNSPTFTVDRGYAGNGTTSYINANYTPSVNANHLAQNSGHFSVYNQLDATSNNGGSGTIGISPSSNIQIEVLLGSASWWGRVNINNGNSASPGATAAGFYVADRTASNATVMAKNGADQQTNADVSVALPTTPMLFLAEGSTTVPTKFTALRIAASSIGGSLGSSGRAALASALNSYMTSIGANVY